MFITYKILEIITKTKDEALGLVVGAKEAELVNLRAQIEDLRVQLKYEKTRGDTLVDRLLQKEAHVAAVAPVAEHVSKHKDDEAVKRLKVIFDEMNSMGADVPPRVAEGRAFEVAGGVTVEA